MPRTISKRLHDLQFSRSVVKGNVVEYQFQVFWCPACRAYTPWPKEFWQPNEIWRNLASFCVFETIDLCVSQLSVTQTLNRLFGFQMNENVVHRIKESAAKYYEQTRKNILSEWSRAS